MTNIAYKMGEHENPEQHKQSVTYSEEKVESALQRHNIEKDSVDPTCNIFRLVYAETKANVAFLQHPQFVELMKMNKVDVGTLHFSKSSAQRIQKSIAITLHNDLIHYLKTQRPPVALILDSSTDSNGRNILLLYFRIFYTNYPHVFLYNTVQLTSEKSAAIMTKIEETFAADGILDLMKSNLKGVATDGASSMVGAHAGLKALLRTFTSNPLLPHTHCYAHRIELCINKAFNNAFLAHAFNLKASITTSINGLSDFYGSRAVKRKAELVEQCDQMNIKM